MATCLPLLLGSVNPIPDDTAVPDLPRGQVDYLSHDWREEDVWRSWRSMTRLKNEIANGVRLENASWRTWWKQRNGLKTVTPETLNWLKDSDVTWLYGPLHTAEPTPRPSPSAADALVLPSTPSPSPDGSTVTRKPILKHRSICELLTSEFPQSPVLSPPDSEEEDDAPQIMSDGDPGLPHNLIRPSLVHTKSDTHITRWGPNRVFRRDSPPRVVGQIPASSLLQSDSPPPSVAPGQKRKHISFNTFVEQCIAIDKPKKKRPHYSTAHPQFGHSYPLDDDGYDEDSEDGIIDEVDELLFGDDHHDEHTDSPAPPYSQISHLHPPHHSPPPHSVSPPSSTTSEEEEDDDVLQMHVRHPMTPPRSPSHSSSSTSSSPPRSRPPKARSGSYAPTQRSGFIMRSPSTDKELVTIAFIAPTMLKTKLDEDDNDHNLPCSPPQTPLPAYSRRTRNSHNGKDSSPHGPHDSPVELVYVPPSYVYSVTEDSEELIEGSRQTTVYEATLTVQPQLLDQPILLSLPDVMPTPVARQGHNVDFVDPMQLLGPGVDPEATRIPTPAEGTCSITSKWSLAGPEVIVSSPDGHVEVPRSRSLSRSRSRSRSRTPSPNTIASSTNAASSSVAVLPRANTPTQGTGDTFLVPSDSGISRGRSASSSSLSSQAQAEQLRGRSITRTSSFSDRESLNTGSPLGSLSPDGNVGLGIGSVGVRDRERDAKGDKEGRRSTERGRDRYSRRSGSHPGSGSSSSLSPEAPHSSTAAHAALDQPEQPPVPEVRKKCTAESSSSGSSTVTAVSTCAARSPPRLVLDAKPITQTSYTEAPSSTIPISPDLAQEEQESISRQPTPANSPVHAMYSSHIPSKSSPLPHAIRHERKPSGGSRSPTRSGDESQQGTLVGRAVEIMSNAGAFLGSFWQSGAAASVTTS